MPHRAREPSTAERRGPSRRPGPTTVRDAGPHLLGRATAEGRRARVIATQVLRHPANAAHPVRALARATWWQARKRVVRRPVDVDFEGFTLRCHPDSGSASNVWYFTSRYDHAEMAFLDRYLRAGDAVLDVGANIGTYTLFMAARVGSTGWIGAVEADPVAAARLRENVARNDLGRIVDVHEVAVDASPGSVAFFTDRDVANGIASPGDPRGSSTEVPAARLDSLVTRRSDLAVAKLDVEGVEVRALAGAADLLGAQRPPVWLVEVIRSQLRWFGSTVDDLVAVFAEAGFEPYLYDEGTHGLRPWSAPPAGTGNVKANVLFVATAAKADVDRRLASAP